MLRNPILLVLCDDLIGVGSGWVGREAQEGGDICVYTSS